MPSKNLLAFKDPSIPPIGGPNLEPDYETHYQTWKDDPGPHTMGPLLKAVNPVIDSALKSYGGFSSASPTLRTRAQLLAADAIKSYDPQRAKLRTHLMTNLQGLRRYAAREGQVVRVPERVGIDLHRLKNSEAELRDQFNREPSMAELADHSGLSRRRIQHVRRAGGLGMTESQTHGVGEDGDINTHGPAVVSTDGDRVWHEFVYGDLDPVDQKIMEHSLGLFDQPVLPKKLIARKLGISPGAVSQRSARIQKLIDRRDELPATF
jgi:DNA-directed RNA polymerase specialized sigma subunit